MEVKCSLVVRRKDLKCIEFLNWEDYLAALKKIRTKDFNEKIELFFKVLLFSFFNTLKMMDTDKSGTLSWDEAFEICEVSLKICFSRKDKQFIKSLSEFFADLIFKVHAFCYAPCRRWDTILMTRFRCRRSNKPSGPTSTKPSCLRASVG